MVRRYFVLSMLSLGYKRILEDRGLSDFEPESGFETKLCFFKEK